MAASVYTTERVSGDCSSDMTTLESTTTTTITTHQTDFSSRGRGAREQVSDPLDLLDLLGLGEGGWAGRGLGRRSSEHGPGPRQAPRPGECCYSSSGCSWACSPRGSLQPPSGSKVSMNECPKHSFGHLTFVSCGLGGPCILQLYMF